MAATIDELKELALLAREAGDVQLEERALEQLIAMQSQPEQDIVKPRQSGQMGRASKSDGEFIGAGVVEPALAVASGLIAEPVAGLAGIVGGGSADAIAKTREALTFKPKTQAGQKGLITVGDLIQRGIDVVNFPISGLAGLAEIILGQGLDKAAETVGSIQDVGVSKTLGERTFEETGSPLLASIAETAPTAALSAMGLRTKAGKAPSIGAEKAKDIQRAIAAGERAGVPVLTSDVFMPNTIVGRLNQQFAERIPGFGTGGKRGAQQTARVNALMDLDKSVPKVQAADIIENLNASANKMKKAAGSRINAVVGAMDDTGSAVPVDATIKAIDDVLADLTRKGKIPDKGLIAEVENLKATLSEAPQSFSSLREFRTDVRSIADKVDPSGRSQLRSSDKAKIDRIVSGLTNDLDRFVEAQSGAKAFSRYKAADRIYSEEAAKLTKSRLKTVLDKGDVNPELVNNLLFSSSPSQVRLLYKNLDASGRQNARMALYRKALDASVTKGELSPEKFVTQLNKMSDNFDVFFKGQDKIELDGLKRLLEITGRAGQSGVVSPTGQALQAPLAAGVVAGAALGDPKSIATLFGAGTLGVMNRAYESAGVRNMLIRLGKAPKRSTLEADLVRSIPLLIESANRSISESKEAGQSK